MKALLSFLMMLVCLGIWIIIPILKEDMTLMIITWIPAAIIYAGYEEIAQYI